MSQLDDFIDKPMGPGLTGDNPPGQAVHPEAPQSATAAPSPPPSANRGGGPGRDPTMTAPGQKLGSEIAAARVSLGDPELSGSAPGEAGGGAPLAGAGASGLGASLGLSDPTPQAGVPAADPDQAENEQADARLAHMRAQGGKPEWSAPDQTRAEANAGSINNTDGL